MKVLRQLCAVTVLTIMLAQVAPAEEGVIHPGLVPPPPPSTNGVIHPGSANPSEEPNNEDTSIDLVTEMTLNLVQSLLTLF